MDGCELLGACGLFCGACNHYRASFPEGEHLQKSTNPKKLSLEKYTCKGCHSNNLYIHQGCVDCKIRICAENKEIQHCGMCKEFPCDILIEFKNDGRIHHLYIFENLQELNTMGIEKWLKQQKQTWKCKCGYEYSWYEESCNNCGSNLKSYKKKE